MWTCKHVYEVYNLSARNIDLGPANRPTPVPEDTERSYIDGPDGIPIDSVTGEPYWVAELERQFAAADAERRERERKGRLRKLQHPARRRRSYPLDVGDQVGTSPPLSTRLPRWLDEQIRQELDALDVPYALRNESVLDDVADSSDGIEEVDVLSSTDDETVDSGMRRHASDEANMGLGAEAHSAEELEDAAIGDALPGRRGVTRDNEVHGSGFLDNVDRAEDELR